MFNTRLKTEIAALKSQVTILLDQLAYSRKQEEQARLALERERDFWREEFRHFSDRIEQKMTLEEAGQALVGDKETQEEREAREKEEEAQREQWQAMRSEMEQFMLGPSLFIDGQPIDAPDLAIE
jgi:hypothetical protein